MTQISLIIFDVDGVLVDSELLSAQILMHELAAAGIDIDLDFFFRNCIGRPFADVAQRIEKHRGRALPNGFESHYRTQLIRRFESELRPMPGVMEMLERLLVPYCLATNSSSERLAATLAIAGLGHPFAGLIFTAAMAGRAKPAPDMFLLAARTFGAAPGDCLVIEDSDTGIQAARAAGMQVWCFTGGSHLKGPGAVPPPPTPADFEFDDMSRFIQLLNGE